MLAPRMLRLRLQFALIPLAALAAGCGSPAAVSPTPGTTTTYGPNEGPVAALPGGAAVEISTEGSGDQTRLVATFFASEAADAPLSPAPTDVSIDLAMPGGESTNLPLSPSGGDSARFASAPGDYLFDPLSGKVNATIGGQPASVPFSTAQY